MPRAVAVALLASVLTVLHKLQTVTAARVSPRVSLAQLWVTRVAVAAVPQLARQEQGQTVAVPAALSVSQGQPLQLIVVVAVAVPVPTPLEAMAVPV
jgi:hypothetical protein